METYDYNNSENNQNKENENVQYQPYHSEKKVAAGVLAILLGALGIHKFYLGYNQEGVILLLITLIGIPILTFVTCGMGVGLYFVVGILPLVEGIIYLSMSDKQFDDTYVKNRKPWF